jgi:hypothetical protein
MNEGNNSLSSFIKRLKCIFKYSSPFTMNWGFLVSFATVISLFIIPMNIGMGFYPFNSLYKLEISIDMIILCDILVSFVTEVVTDVEIKDHIH